jgi:hypothetical protein
MARRGEGGAARRGTAQRGAERRGERRPERRSERGEA